MTDAARPAAADGLVVPPPSRRPRVREVSSRFLSSSPSLSTPGGEDVQIRASVKPSKQFGAGVSTPIIRRSYTDFSPLGSHNYCYTNVKESKQQRGAAVKLFKENKNAVAAGGGKGDEQQLSDDDNVVFRTATGSTGTGIGIGTSKYPSSSSSRPDTPITTSTTGTGKYSSSSRPDTPITTTTTSTGTGKSSSSSRPDTPIATTTGTGYFTTATTVNGTGKSSSRPDTPMATGTNRIVPSRFRQLSTPSSQNFHPSQTNKLIIPASAAAKLLQSSGLSTSAMESHCLVGDEAKVPTSSSNIREEEGLGCSSKTFPNSPISQNNSRTRSLNSDTRSSMPDTRLLLAETSSSNSIVNNVSDSHLNLKFSACSRSLNLPLSNSVKMMGESLSLPPPHPACTKLGHAADVARKGRKIFNHQEQVHSLRLLHNNYLQWRFANAKAEASLHAQTRDTEIKLHSLGVKISDLRNDVERKRIELGLLQRTKTLSTIIETHMPYLDEWSALEEEYSTSLSATTHALVNSLVRLPVSGNVQADIREVGESLNSAIKVMEMIGIHVQSFMPKANKMDTLITELARLAGGERVLIEECGDLLFKTFTSQVEDCSLRGHLMQLQNNQPLPTTGIMEEL